MMLMATPTPNRLATVMKGLTRKKFHTWLRKQKDGRKFNYMDTGNCVAATFIREVGRIRVKCGGLSAYTPMNICRMPMWLQRYAVKSCPRNSELPVMSCKKLKKLIL